MTDSKQNKGSFGKEIEFRASLEAELRRGKPLKYYEYKRKRKSSAGENTDDPDEYDSSIPMVLIVVQGGPNTLLTGI